MVLWPISFIESVESRVLKFYIIFTVVRWVKNEIEELRLTYLV